MHRAFWTWRAAGVLAVWAALLAVPANPAGAATISWTGATNSNWATGTNWSNGSGPGTSDTASFTDTKAETLPGEVTSILNANRTVGGLAFSNTTGKYHTLDLNAYMLTVNGNLNFNSNQSGNTTTVVRNGTLAVNSGSFGSLNVGRALSGASNAVTDFSGLTALNASVQEVHVGSSAISSAATGTLTLAPSNSITAQRIYVGAVSGVTENRGTVNLGASNTILAAELNIGKETANGTVSIANGGTLNLGSAGQRTNLFVAVGTYDNNKVFSGRLDLTGAAAFNAYLGDVIVGQRDVGTWGTSSGTLVGGNGGSVDIGAPGNTANFHVGRKLTSNEDYATATGSVDFSGLGTLTASLNAFTVGTALTGSATGTVKLAKTSTISANSITVGAGVNGSSGTLVLGKTNNIQTSLWTIGEGNTNGTVTIAAGGGLTLGSGAQRTALSLGVGTFDDNRVFNGKLDLTGGATFTAYLADVTVGQKDVGEWGTASGTLVGAGAGTVDIGAPGNTANFHVGRKLSGGDQSFAIGTVNFGGLSALTASLNAFSVGTAATGSGTGTVTLANSNTIDARTITVGAGTGGSGTMTLGRTNVVLADQVTIGRDHSSGLVTVPSGGSLTLGSAGRRAALYLSTGGFDDNQAFTGKLDLTGAAFNAYLSDLIVGQKDGGQWGSTAGTLIGAGGGSVDIAGAGATAANIYIGRRLLGGEYGSASGNVDLSGLSTLTATVGALALGTAMSSAASGTLKLAATSTITADTITVGSGVGDGSSTLTLGMTNTVLANQLVIGQDASNGSVVIPSGGTLTLGSPARRTSVTIATGTTNTNNTHSGTLDLTNATFVAWLDNVIVGQKNAQPGTKLGTLTISARPDNRVDANTITLGGNQSTGTLNFGGGQLVAGAIAKGTGTANFNWTGGQLSVGTFGTAAIPFNLGNTGAGTLAPGSSGAAIGTTTVYGNYTQGVAATTALEIAGDTSGTGNDLLSVSGSAALAGTLRLSTLNNFAPSLGQNYLLATYASRTGTFGFVAPPKMPQGVAFQLDYGATQLVMRTVAPTAQNWTGTAPTGTFGTAGNWDTATAPGTTSSVSLVNNTAGAQTVTVSASTTVHRVALQGATAPMNLEVPQGIQLGVANQVVVGANATLSGGGRVLGDVVVAGGGTLAPGSGLGAMAIDGALTGQSSSTLVFELGGAGGTQHDEVDLTGAAALSGRLDVRLVNGFVPVTGQSFRVLQGSSRTGEFAQVTGVVLGAGRDADHVRHLVASYDATGVSLLAVENLLGDADRDGTVGFADLLAVAQNYDRPDFGTWTGGDFDGDGAVNFADLLVVAQRYDRSDPGAAPSASFEGDWARALAAVPEPSGPALLGLALLAAGRRRRAR